MASFSALELIKEPADLIKASLNHHKLGNIELALSGYQLVLSKIPNTSEVASTINSNLGAIYMSKGEWESAKTYFLAATECEQATASAYFNLAVVLTSKLNQHAKAIKYCGIAMRKAPTYHKAGEK